MQSTDIPRRLVKPFAAGAGGSYIRTVPVDSQIGVQDGAASLTDGFPPLTFQDVGSGGVPPFGKDMNGILNDVSAWSRWIAAGGAAMFNSTFATAIGGYPKYAILASTTAGVLWQSTAENNVTDPDGGSPAGWAQLTGNNSSPNAESVTLPNGKILKDGYINATYATGGTYSVTFETPFPNACRRPSVVAINSNGSPQKDNFAQIVTWDRFGFTWVCQGTNTGGINTIDGITWDASGY